MNFGSPFHCTINSIPQYPKYLEADRKLLFEPVEALTQKSGKFQPLFLFLIRDSFLPVRRIILEADRACGSLRAGYRSGNGDGKGPGKAPGTATA